MISIYDYQDYRRYLRALLEERKKEGKPLSHRAIQRKMGITSSGFLSNVLAGRNNLTLSQAARLAKVLKLSRGEAGYFETMVMFTQAKSIEDKNEYFERLLAQQKAKLKVLTGRQLSVFSRWHYAVIRELANFTDLRDTSAVARMIDPPVTPAEASEAVKNLIALGFLRQDDEGRIVQNDDLVSSGDEVRSFEVVNFQAAALDRAKRALERIPAADRDISVLTVTASAQSLQRIKEEIRGMRKRILQIVRADEEPERVYQCSINLFPATVKKRKA